MLRAASPRGEIVLAARDDGTLELRVNGVLVMDSRETSSERLLARAALARVADPGRVLVGGLGLGFTAADVLADPRVRSLDVVEIEEAVVGWFTDGSVPHGPALLHDGRLRLHVAEVLSYLSVAEPASYDVVLLDVDNGPDQLVYLANMALYTRLGLAVVRRALAPGGVVVVWSAHPAPRLADELRTTVGAVTTHRVPVRLGDRDEEYWVYGATR